MDLSSSGLLRVFTVPTCIFNPPEGTVVGDIICKVSPVYLSWNLYIWGLWIDPFWEMDSGESSSVTPSVTVTVALSETLRA